MTEGCSGRLLSRRYYKTDGYRTGLMYDVMDVTDGRFVYFSMAG